MKSSLPGLKTNDGLFEKGFNQISTKPKEHCIGNCRNVRGLGKSMVVFRLFEKLKIFK